MVIKPIMEDYKNENCELPEDLPEENFQQMDQMCQQGIFLI